jgi:hypothetical protein
MNARRQTAVGDADVQTDGWMRKLRWDEGETRGLDIGSIVALLHVIAVVIGGRYTQ